MHMYGDADKIVQCILKGCHIISVMNMWEWWIKKQSNWLARAEEIALKKNMQTLDIDSELQSKTLSF